MLFVLLALFPTTEAYKHLLTITIWLSKLLPLSSYELHATGASSSLPRFASRAAEVS